MEIGKTFRFEASHVLPKHPGKCSRLHGHSWVVRIYVKGEIDNYSGFVMDFADISAIMKPLIDQLDHHHLGTWGNVIDPGPWMPGNMTVSFYPTSENLLVWIADHINFDLPKWSRLEIEETCTSAAILTKEEYDRFYKA